MNTDDLNTGNDILKDLKRNAPINNNAKDNNQGHLYNYKPTENTLSYNLNVAPLLYRDRNDLHYKNKILDEYISTPENNYESNGGRTPQFFTSTKNSNYSTPPLERTSSRY